MTAKFDDLTPTLREKAFELFARCNEAKIHLLLLDTLRTKEQQAENIKNNVSWTMNSKHLPGADGKSRALDVVPYKPGTNILEWNGNHPVWQTIGKIGKSLGLVWGGDWKQKDMGHFQLGEK